MEPLYATMIHNIGSLLLGISAWVFACCAINSKNPYTLSKFSIASFSSCTCSLLLQLLEISNRVSTGDFSAIEDTIRAVIIAASVLVVITITLNIVAFAKGHKLGKE